MCILQDTQSVFNILLEQNKNRPAGRVVLTASRVAVSVHKSLNADNADVREFRRIEMQTERRFAESSQKYITLDDYAKSQNGPPAPPPQRVL